MFPVLAPEQLNVAETKRNFTIMLLGPALIHGHEPHASSAAPGSSAAFLWLVLAPPPRHGCVSSQPCSSHPPPLSDSALLLFHQENRKEPFQSLHDQVCHLSRVCTKFSALCLLTLRSHLRANLMPRTPSSVFLVKNFAPVMNELPFFSPFLWEQFYTNIQ